MNRQEATDFVVSELSKHRHRNDIIMDLCKRTGGSWGQVQRFVQQVESENRQSIAARQSPILLVTGVFIVLTGLALVVYVGIATLRGTIFFFPSIPIPYLGNLSIFVTGSAMTGGGIIGVLRAIRPFLR